VSRVDTPLALGTRFRARCEPLAEPVRLLDHLGADGCVWLDGETGFVVESGDEAVLADRLVTLLDDQDLCLRMGRRANEVALGRFTPDAVARQTVEAYRTALS